MTWLVTGGSGFVGLHLLRRLAADGIAARSLDTVPLGEALDGVVGKTWDIREAASVRRALDGVEVVVHAAAALPSRASELESVNVEGSRLLARLAAEAGVRRAIMVSSAVVYGLLPPPVREGDIPLPVERYGRSKLRAETAWLREAPGPLVLRPAAVVGPERLGVFGILFRWIAEGRRLYVLGDGANRYQLLDVDDLVEAIVRAARLPVGGVLNLGGRVSGSVRDDLEALVRLAGSSSRVVGVPARPAQALLALLDVLRLSPLSAWHRRSAVHDVVLDCTRARELLGGTPERDGAEALARAYDWFAAEGRGRAPGVTHRTAWRERSLALLRRLS